MSPVLLSDLDPEVLRVWATWRITTPATRERLMIIGATGLVAVLMVLWAVLIRKKHRHRHSHHHAHQHSSKQTEVAAVPVPESTPAPPEKRRRRRRSSRRHRPRNPTLAETGGLPPVRAEDPPEPQT
jgi:hypothetical protein